ncbi:MAG TPA: response regulator [Bacteroidetes bacterium]|nr:response regulator [Bacteroidota bacterium]
MKEKDIVLIEDNPNDAELAIKALRKGGAVGEIHVLNDGAAALEYFFGMGKFKGRQTKILPSLVLLDLMIPKVSGFEVLELIRANKHTRYIPVVVFSSSSVDEDIEKAYRLGANAFIVKPIDFKAYSELMKSVAQFWINCNKNQYQ